MKVSLSNIDKVLTAQKQELICLIDNLEFVPFISFKLNETKSLPKLGTELSKRSGLYFFELYMNKDLRMTPETTRNHLMQLWNESSFKKLIETDYEGKSIEKKVKMKCPRIIKSRLNRHQKLDEWLPFYLGKSDDLLHRITEHVEQPWDKTTSSMKLEQREQFHGMTFRVSTLFLDVQNYDFIVPFYESKFRNILTPIIGKQ